MAEKVVAEAQELPKAIVRRVVKDKLSELSKESEISVLKEALHAFGESSRIFIHYLSATANDICKESKRQTINAEDVFKALEEIEFPEFIEPLKASLEEFRRKNALKRSGSSKATEANKKSKKKEEPTKTGGEEKEDGKEGNEDDEEKQDGKEGNDEGEEDGNAHVDN